MLLEGSCHCRAVTFSVESAHPYPFNLCYCGICRKTQGSGGFAINLAGDNATLKVDGEAHVTVYQATLESGERSPSRRHFCSRCGSALWAWDPRWPELVHPTASAVDTPLPVPPARTHLMLDYRPKWVADAVADGDICASEYPEEAIAEWHERLGLSAP